MTSATGLFIWRLHADTISRLCGLSEVYLPFLRISTCEVGAQELRALSRGLT
jgi:hypothetical protein